MNIGLDALLWCIDVKSMLRGVHELLGVGCPPLEPSHALDDVSDQAFDRALVIVIPSHIIESV